MKLGSVTKFDKKNKMTPKIFGDDVMSTSCDVIIICPIYGQFGAIQKPDSGRIVSKISLYNFTPYLKTSPWKAHLDYG